MVSTMRSRRSHALLLSVALIATACGGADTATTDIADTDTGAVLAAESPTIAPEIDAMREDEPTNSAGETTTSGPVEVDNEPAGPEPDSAETTTTAPEPPESTKAPGAASDGTGEDGSAETTMAPETTTTAPTTTTTTAAPESTTTAAPGRQVNLVGGGQFDLNSIEGTDTVLWFWAPW